MINVRQVKPSDADALVALLVQLWEDGQINPAAPAELCSQLQNHDQLFVIAIDHNRPIGYCSVRFEYDLWRDELIGRITHIVVDTQQRGQGVGGCMLDYVVKQAKQRDCQRLMVYSALHYRHSFYTSHGFAHTSNGYRLDIPT